MMVRRPRHFNVYTCRRFLSAGTCRANGCRSGGNQPAATQRHPRRNIEASGLYGLSDRRVFLIPPPGGITNRQINFMMIKAQRRTGLIFTDGPTATDLVCPEGGCFMDADRFLNPHMAVIRISATNDRHPANVIYVKTKTATRLKSTGSTPKAAPGTVKPSMQVWRTFRKK